MNILILQGPNLNLLGLKSKEIGCRLTLDKLNKAIRDHIRMKNVNLKILQTHKQFQAMNFLQRNRNLADGLLFIPTSWAKHEWTLAETLNLVSIPTAIVYFNPPYSFGTTESESIFNNEYHRSFSGQPMETCLLGMDYLLSVVK
tara:strand:+ start:318 stop:749 length:432 start_codon:yes stop_codon:yes gene_type:complete